VLHHALLAAPDPALADAVPADSPAAHAADPPPAIEHEGAETRS
jgi:hypothetical protein